MGSRPILPQVAIPLPSDKPALRFWRVTPGKEHHLVFASATLATFTTHFVASRTVPCLAHYGRCEHCGWGCGQLVSSYAVVLLGQLMSPWLICLGQAATGNCPGLLAHNGQLAGWEVTAKRGTASRTGPVVLRWTDRHLDKPLPVLPTVLESLGRLWGVDLGEGRGD